MNTNIKTTGVDLTPQVSMYIEKRLSKIRKIVNGDPSVQCDIEVAKTTGHHQKGDIFMAEIHVVGAGKDAFARSEKEDLFSAVDDVRDEILRSLKANKEKKLSLIRRSGARVKNMIKGLWSFGRKGEEE